MKKLLFFLTILFISITSTLAVYILISSLLYLIAGSEKANGILTKATIYLFFLKFTGTLAFICIGLATSLGALRNVIFSFYRNQNFWKIHTRWASSIGVGMAAAHLTIYLLYEYRLKVPLTLKLFIPVSFSTKVNSNLVFISLTALIVFTINLIITNIQGVTGKKWWKPIHLLNYLGFFLVLIHAYFIGSDSSQITFILLYGIFLILAVSGSIARFFAFSNKFMKPKAQVVQPVPPPNK